MLTKLRELLYMLDDERFLADISTPENCHNKITNLRQRRSLLVVGALLMYGFILIAGVSSTTVILFGMIVTTTTLMSLDIQIKMLLLHQKTLSK